MRKNKKMPAGPACSAFSAESRFKRMVEGLRREYFFYCHGADGVFRYVSPSIKNILGYSQAGFLKNFDEYLTPAPGNRLVAGHTRQSIKGRRQPPYEVEIYHKNGSIRTLEVLEMPVRERGRVVAVEGIARDITEQKRLQSELAAHDREMTAQAALILRSSGDGIIGVDPEGLVIFMNEAAEKMLGWRMDEMKGRALHRAIHSKRPDGILYPEKDCPMSAVLRRGKPGRVEDEVLWRRDGSHFPVSYSVRPIIKDGARAGAVITFRDVAERKRLEEMREFLTHAIVHDLNNPLTSIMAGAEMAAECPGHLPGCANRDQLALVSEAALEMRKMISDILDINRMEQGKMKLGRSSCSPSEMIGSAASAMALAAKYGSRGIAAAGATGLPGVMADERIIRRVLENLSANALRYAPQGTTVKLSASAGRRGTVRFSVSDEGPGVKRDHLPRIFDKYFQSAPAAAGSRAGKGIGLAFCRLAIEAHGGRVWAENLRPKGFSVRFELPVSGVKPGRAAVRAKK